MCVGGGSAFIPHQNFASSQFARVQLFRKHLCVIFFGKEIPFAKESGDSVVGSSSQRVRQRYKLGVGKEEALHPGCRSGEP